MALPTILETSIDLPEQTFPPGYELIEEGTRAGRLYILVEGSVEVVKDDVRVVATSEPGAVFGEISVLLGTSHTATVRTLDATKMRVVEDAEAFLSARSDVMLPIARLLARRLNFVTGYLVDLKRQFEDERNHLGMVDEVLESLVHHQGDD